MSTTISVAELAALLNEVFPMNLPPSRLRNNPPPTVAVVVDVLRKARDGANDAYIDQRAASYLRNARCIAYRRIWRDGGREYWVTTTPAGDALLDYLIAPSCPRCDGTGVIELPTRYGAYWLPDTAPCPLCVAPPTDEPPF